VVAAAVEVVSVVPTAVVVDGLEVPEEEEADTTTPPGPATLVVSDPDSTYTPLK